MDQENKCLELGQLPLEDQTELERVDMVDLLNLDDVSDGHGDVDTDGNSSLLDLVKTEGRNLLVVVVLQKTLCSQQSPPASPPC